MLLNPGLLEINTRVWIKQFAPGARFSDIGDKFIEDLKFRGIGILWLMGIWKTSPSLAKKCCFGINLVPGYVKALDDWKKDDVIGSPFAIDDYVVNPELGSRNDLLDFRQRLNKNNIKLFLDFIPNHFGADSPLICSNPDIFLRADKDSFVKDPYAFFEYKGNKSIYVAHGRDPFFPPWEDTAQLNYFEPKTREFMLEKLLNIASMADGVRCDMAMLPLNNVFQNTWMGVLGKSGYSKPADEFWKNAISSTKAKYPDFLFMAEAYWGLEWQLQQLGFDYTYDKILTDRLSEGDVQSVRSHLQADKTYQMKSVRFIENHDEERALSKFGRFKSLAAAVVISTIQGAHFYYNGQFEGRKIKLPVQLGREPEEKTSQQVLGFYENLLQITKAEIFKAGTWQMLNPSQTDPSNNKNENILAWQWSLDNELRIVVINYSHTTSQCRLNIDLSIPEKEVRLEDLLTNIVYNRVVSEMRDPGLFIELKGYQSHIFSVVL
jgi:hypothetical protein